MTDQSGDQSWSPSPNLKQLWKVDQLEGSPQVNWSLYWDRISAQLLPLLSLAPFPSFSCSALRILSFPCSYCSFLFPFPSQVLILGALPNKRPAHCEGKKYFSPTFLNSCGWTNKLTWDRLTGEKFIIYVHTGVPKESETPRCIGQVKLLCHPGLKRGR